MVMSKRRRRTTRPRGERFLMLQFWEMESPAYLALSPDARSVYLDMRKRLNFDASNNGAVPYSHRDACAILHSSWRRGANALLELRHFGFTKLHNAGVPGAILREAGEWELTVAGMNGRKATKDFLRHDGTPFEPPYRSHLGEPTRSRRGGINESASHRHVATDSLQHDGGFRNLSDSSTKPRAKVESADSWPAILRRRAGLSQARLAKKAGISRGYLAMVEQGRRTPKPKIVQRITVALAECTGNTTTDSTARRLQHDDTTRSTRGRTPFGEPELPARGGRRWAT
jgi:DNA-binding XRE family transcriptional regulator